MAAARPMSCGHTMPVVGGINRIEKKNTMDNPDPRDQLFIGILASFRPFMFVGGMICWMVC